MTVYPEVVRIPLIMHIPERLKPLVTTDLTRVALSTDIVPSFYALLGHDTHDLGPLFGSTLFVPADRELAPRRRGSFLVASSYAATYGVLRRNGKSMYIADLIEGRECAYDLTKGPLGHRVPVTDDMRRVSQRVIRDRIQALADLYQFVPPQ